MRIVAAASVLAVLGGCSSSYLANVPFEMEACPWKKEDPRRTSLAAMLQSMEENRWSMVQGSAADGYLRARACRHTTCASVDVYVDAGGNVQVFRPPGEAYSRNEAQLVEAWMVKLDKRFKDNRCEPAKRAFDRLDKLTLLRGFVPGRPRPSG